MKLVKTILSLTIAVAFSVSAAVSAAAANKLSREDVIQKLWVEWTEQYSNENNDLYDIDNPRTSMDHYILNEWLDKYYGKEKAYENAEESCDWTDTSSIEKSYQAYYYAQLKKHKVYISSEDAGEPINFYSNDTGKVIYTFSRSGQTWHVLDKNKNVLFSFPVKIPEKAETKAPTWNNNGGYETESTGSSEVTTSQNDNENKEEMTGVTPYAWNSEVQSAGNNSAEADNESDKSAETKKMTESKSEKKEKSDSASYILYIGIAAIVAAVVIVAVKYKKKK